MEVIKTADFEKDLRKIPDSVRELFLVQEGRFQTNSHDSRLHMKKLKDLDGAFSFRITRNYRVLFYFHTENAAVLFKIGHRKDVYR